MMKKRGLGRGLDALLVDYKKTSNETAYENKDHNQQDLHFIPLHQLKRGKYQPRKEIPIDSLEELSESIKAQGIIQPVVVRLLDNQSYEVIAGERRWRAAELAGLTEIPALVRDIADEAAIAMALIENIQREDLNPLEEAVALQRLIDEFEMTHQETAKAIGRSRTAVTNLLRLLNLSDKVKLLLERGELEMGHARALLTLNEEDQHEAAQIIITNALSAREAEDLVRKLSSPSAPRKHSEQSNPTLIALQQDLERTLNTKIKIKQTMQGKGNIVIQYKNTDELKEIVYRIVKGKD